MLYYKCPKEEDEIKNTNKGDKKMFERFSTTPGCHYANLDELSLEELAAEIRSLPEWDADLLRELCWRADMIEEWDAAEDDSESVAFAAAKKLGVKIS